MKNNLLKDWKAKSYNELIKELISRRQALAKSELEFKINLPKDTNSLKKDRKAIAQLLTIINQKIPLRQAPDGA